MTVQEVREAMGPELCEIADLLREQFNARLTYLKTDSIALGMKPAHGVPTQWNGERVSGWA